jgi:hypothetical protein
MFDVSLYYENRTTNFADSQDENYSLKMQHLTQLVNPASLNPESYYAHKGAAMKLYLEPV